MSEAPAECSTCRKTPRELANPLKRCAKCSNQWYCSRECQKADWKGHKKVCGSARVESAPISQAAPSSDSQPRSQPSVSGKCCIPKPFTALNNGTWLHNRPKKDVFKLLVDTYRMRIEDEYVFQGEVDEDSLYSGASAASALRHFKRFLTKAIKKDAARKRKLLPEWWTKESLNECLEFARTDEFSNVGYAVEKHDIQEHYSQSDMPMQLRMFSEKIDGTLAAGMSGETMLQLRVAGRDAIVCVGGEIYFGQITFETAKYINIKAVEMKTSTEVESKFYKNELTFLLPLKEHQQHQDSCNLTLRFLTQVSNKLRNYKFIERFDHTYHDAIATMESESFIGLCIPGVERGRFSTNSLIACSTSDSIFIFDIVVMGRIETDLKNILESDVPKKIIHNAGPTADYLFHVEKINLKGVFDTMVAHFALGFDPGFADLQNCLKCHFKLPEKFFDKDIEQYQWHRRPISSNEREILAQNVAFLRKLHSLLSRKMLEGCDNC